VPGPRGAGATAARPGPPVRLDLYGDPLPEGAILRLGTERPARATFAVVYSPNGTLLASASWDMTVRLWDVSTGGERWRVFLGWGPGGKPTPRGKEVLPAVAFSPDSKTLAGSGADHAVHLWDTARGKEVGCIDGKAGKLAGLAFAPDGKTLAAAGADGSIRLWDPATGRERRCFEGHEGEALCVAFSADGRALVSGGADKTVRLWDVETGKQLHCCKGHEAAVHTAFFVMKGAQIASMEKGPGVRLWDVESGKERHRFDTFGTGYALLRGPDEASVLTIAANRNETWDVRSGTNTATIYLPQHVGYFCGALAPDGKVLAVGQHRAAVALMEYPSGKERRRLIGADPEVHAVAFAPDDKTLATGTGNNTVVLWDLAAGKVRDRLEGHREHVHALAWSPNGKRLASASGTTIRLWDVDATRERHCLDGHTGYVTRLAFSPDSKVLASASADTTVRLWDVSTGEERAVYRGQQAAVWDLAFAPHSRSLATLSDRVCVWDPGTGKERAFPEQKWMTALWYDAEGRLLVLRREYNDGGPFLTLWDVTLDAKVAEIALPKDGNGTMTFALSPDGRTLATGRHYQGQGNQRMSVHLWEVATGKQRRRYDGHEGCFIEDLAFSPDGKTLASGSSDSTVLLWDVYRTPGEMPRGKPTEEKARQLWDDLRSPEAGVPFASLSRLLAVPEQAVALLQRELRPVPKLKPNHLARLIADLDAEEFATRQRAMAELEKLGEVAEAPLRRALEGGPSLEVRRRAAELLTRIERQRGPNPPPERLRTLRSVELLEHLGTPEARALLQDLASGEPEAPLTRQARAALRRLPR
jgi:WD40 repeat protein